MATFLDPKKVLKQLDLKPDMVAADFGCGAGIFTIFLAKTLEDGLVYALDIQTGPLSSLKSQANMEGVRNIRTIRTDLERPRGSTISDSSLDLVLIVNVLFQIKDRGAIITEAKRALKKGGKLLIIDWSSEAPQGPVEGRVAPEEAESIIKEKGFEKIKEIDAGKYHYGLLFIKNK